MSAKTKKRRAGSGNSHKNDAGTARAQTAARRNKRRHGRRTLHHILLIVFLLSAGVLLCLTIFFKIETITVVGSDKYPADVLIAASGIAEGDNLFRVPVAEIEKRLIQEFPYIEHARIHRVFPPGIEIQIEQSKPEIAAAEGGEYVLITRTGKVLERGLVLLTDDILLVNGLDVAGHMPGEQLGVWEEEARVSREETPEEAAAREARNLAAEERAAQEDEAMKMIDYLLDAMEETGFSKLTNLDITNRLNMQVMYENRLLLKLGSEANLADKLLFLDLVVSEKLHPEAHGTLNAADVSSKDQIVYTPASGYNSDGSPIDPLEQEATTEGVQ